MKKFVLLLFTLVGLQISAARLPELSKDVFGKTVMQELNGTKMTLQVGDGWFREYTVRICGINNSELTGADVLAALTRWSFVWTTIGEEEKVKVVVILGQAFVIGGGAGIFSSFGAKPVEPDMVEKLKKMCDDKPVSDSGSVGSASNSLVANVVEQNAGVESVGQKGDEKEKTQKVIETVKGLLEKNQQKIESLNKEIQQVSCVSEGGSQNGAPGSSNVAGQELSKEKKKKLEELKVELAKTEEETAELNIQLDAMVRSAVYPSFEASAPVNAPVTRGPVTRHTAPEPINVFTQEPVNLSTAPVAREPVTRHTAPEPVTNYPISEKSTGCPTSIKQSSIEQSQKVDVKQVNCKHQIEERKDNESLNKISNLIERIKTHCKACKIEFDAKESELVVIEQQVKDLENTESEKNFFWSLISSDNGLSIKKAELVLLQEEITLLQRNCKSAETLINHFEEEIADVRKESASDEVEKKVRMIYLDFMSLLFVKGMNRFECCSNEVKFTVSGTVENKYEIWFLINSEGKSLVMDINKILSFEPLELIESDVQLFNRFKDAFLNNKVMIDGILENEHMIKVCMLRAFLESIDVVEKTSVTTR